MTCVNSPPLAAERRRQLYRIVWRWHFYAGVFCIPVILTLSVSGAIYLFKPQIDDWLERPYATLAKGDEYASADQHISAALKAMPGASFFSYRLPESDQHAVIVSVLDKGKRQLVYVDPYSLAVLKVIGFNDQFVRQVRSFHGELLAGDAGSIVVELAGCWAIVLILSGLFMWWPRAGQRLAGVLYPRLSGGRRQYWRDLHAVAGVWLSIGLLFLLISGLPWATVWGQAFKEVRMLIAPVTSQDWVQSRSAEQRSWQQNALLNVDLSEPVLATARRLDFAPPAELTLVASKTWQLTSSHQNRTLRKVALIDDGTAEVVELTPFSERPLIDRIIGVAISIHEGHLFGWLNQLLGLLVALGAMLLSVTGFVLWRRRKPPGELGAPGRLADMHFSKGVMLTLLLLACLLPLLGISIILILSIEYFVIRRVQPLSRWLGLGH